MSLIRTVPDIRPRHRHDPSERPAPRQLAAYRCTRGHGFEVTFAAGAELPQTADCRCGAAGQLAGQALVAADVGTSDHERRMIQLCGRRTLAELEEILAERLGEVAAMREAGQRETP